MPATDPDLPVRPGAEHAGRSRRPSGSPSTSSSEVPDVLPEAVRTRAGPARRRDQALRWIHRPDDHRQLGAARKRLKFDEAFVDPDRARPAPCSCSSHRQATPRPPAPAGVLDRPSTHRLPFTLTAGQAPVGEEIAAELAGEHPMHRLLQGEVGSGKTLVALRAMLQVVDVGRPGRAARPDRGARPAAPPLDPRRCWATSAGGGQLGRRRQRHPGRAADRLDGDGGPQAGAARRRQRRGRHRDRHARAARGERVRSSTSASSSSTSSTGSGSSSGPR